ncbi:MAG: hydroxypyruvate isomerase family protein [Streptosporangiaceae bacterium]
MADHGRARAESSAPLRFDVNLSIVFAELPLLDRPRAAASAGFSAVELWWPFASPTPARAQLRRLVAALDDAGTRLIACNLFEGDLSVGDRGLLSQAGAGEVFAKSLAAAMELGRATDCRIFNVLYGNHDPRLSERQQRELAVQRLTAAAQAAGEIGATLVLEVLNPLDNPRYALRSFPAAMDIIERVGAAADNVRLLLDLYHAAVIGTDLETVLSDMAGHVGHVQIADCPGRHQPGTGSLGACGLLGPLERAQYDSWVGIEYVPLGPSAASFGWLDDWSTSQ